MSFRKRVTIAVIGASALGLGVASAATLGGLTSESLGADNAVVAGCDPNGLNITYTTAYDAGTGKYRTSQAALNGIDAACNGKVMSITFKGAAGVVVASTTATVASVAGVQTVPVVAPAENIVGVAVVISG